MKKAIIISIGNELLNGRSVDTNTSYLSGRLLAISIPVIRGYTVGDDIDLIVKTLRAARDEADIILVTGGLGPTQDDLTRRACAKFMGAELELKPELLKKIESFFKNRNLKMPQINKTQAYIPAGAEPLANNIGTAAGILVRKSDKLLAFMPGVPTEMKAMFEDSVVPELANLARTRTIVTKRLHCFGAGESTICQMLEPMMQRDRNPQVNCTVKCGIITLHITATGDTAAAGKLVEETEKTIRNRLGGLVYGTNGQNLEDVVGLELTRQGKTVAVAESCTGGLIAKMLTDIAGASAYFTQGWVTYSNESKQNLLAVPAELIGTYGAVSEQVAENMAKNACKKAYTDFAIAVTGIAGPTGASEQKPLGLAYISIDGIDGCETRRFIFSGDRNIVRIKTAQTALNMLRLKL